MPYAVKKNGEIVAVKRDHRAASRFLRRTPRRRVDEWKIERIPTPAPANSN